MKIKNISGSMRHYGGKPLAAGDSMDVPSSWLNALQNELKLGYIEIMQTKPEKSETVQGKRKK